MLKLEIGEKVSSERNVYYRILQQLGRGGNSSVYLVLSLGGEHRGILFALKAFTHLSKPERLEGFRQEIEFLRECDHPSIMRVYDNGTHRITTGDGATEEYPFVVAEYLPKTLHDLIRGVTTTAERLSHTLQLLSALAYLDQHTPPVVHRDIKPKNIFVKGRSCVLGDFGLMKFLDGENEETDRERYKESVGLGMPFYYRTPDLVAYAKQEGPITTKSDVFQLGLVVAQMFTGWNPAKRSRDLLAPVVVESLKDIPGSRAASIRELIRLMLDSNPEIRPAAADLIDDWEGIFREVVTQCHQLEGRVF